MARYLFLSLVIICTFHSSLQDTNDNEVDTEEVNPFAEAAAAILKEQGAQNIASMVEGFLQNGGAAKIGETIGDAISKKINENGGQLLQGLGSLLKTAKKTKNEEDDSAANVLDGLGTLMGAVQNADGGGDKDNLAGALLQGLGSIMGGQGARGGQGGLDPAMIGSLINMFANQKPRSKSSKKKSQTKLEKTESKSKQGLDAMDLLSLAGSFLGQGQGQDAGGSLLSFLPMIMQTINAFTGPEAQKRAESHSDHAWSVPPFLEKVHIAFDNFIHSEMGKIVINALGAEKAFKVFTDEKGRFDYFKFGEMMENRSFRRHWIRMLTDRLSDMLQYAANPETQQT